MASKPCAPCGRRMVGRPTPIAPGRRKEWRVFFDKGQTRDYFTEADADAALAKHCKDPSRCRKQQLSR